MTRIGFACFIKSIFIYFFKKSIWCVKVLRLASSWVQLLNNCCCEAVLLETPVENKKIQKSPTSHPVSLDRLPPDTPIAEDNSTKTLNTSVAVGLTARLCVCLNLTLLSPSPSAPSEPVTQDLWLRSA